MDPRSQPPWVWERYGPESDLSMAYLLTPEATVRQELAAQHVRDCPHVVEIGGYKVPITKYLVGAHESVTVIDPEVDPFALDSWNGRPCRIRHLAQRFQDVSLELKPRSYALVLLGLALRHFAPLCVSAEWEDLLRLARDARVVIVEYCVGWSHAEEDYARLRRDAQLSQRLEIEMRLPEDPRMDPRWAARRFCVLDPPRGVRAGQAD